MQALITPIKLLLDVLELLAKVLQGIPPPRNIRGLNGRWLSRYQRHDPPDGRWVDDTNEVQAKWLRKLSFKNFPARGVALYEAVGKFYGEGEVVGVWRDTRPEATWRGTFHLFLDRDGEKLYGVCTGPSANGQMIYSGWILARGPKQLDEAQSALTGAMLVCR